ncbi:MAG TPA: xanthine dehydrogenase family protein subunit M [Mesorhizobium sp.]|jgi:carbon-monoxide dehydrogenase medium subunit|nr:xanthine dehydrogenase family protein subunit M [Mesorhizobium sp.]
MYALQYHRPQNLVEAAALAKGGAGAGQGGSAAQPSGVGTGGHVGGHGVTDTGGDAKFLAGGHTLIPAMRARLAAPAHLIDLAHIPDLKGIRVHGNAIRIGAMTTHATVAGSAEIASVFPALCDLASHIGDPAVRHCGTIGGSISNNDPAADYPAALLAANATVHTDRRDIPADDFFTGLFETALEDGEIVTAVSFEAPEAGAYEKFRNPASRYAIVGVFVAKTRGVRVAVTGAGADGVFRSTELESRLDGSLDPSRIEDVPVPSDNLMSDMHASAEYRANLITVMAKRALRKAAGAGR